MEMATTASWSHSQHAVHRAEYHQPSSQAHLFPFCPRRQQRNDSLRDAGAIGHDGGMVDELVGAKLEHEERTNKRRDAVRDKLAVDHAVLVQCRVCFAVHRPLARYILRLAGESPNIVQTLEVRVRKNGKRSGRLTRTFVILLYYFGGLRPCVAWHPSEVIQTVSKGQYLAACKAP